VRGVRPGRCDEVPRVRATTTVSVRRELSRSIAGPGAQHTVVVTFWSVSAYVRELY